MSDEDNDDKPFDPSQKRLDEARKRGEIARAPDVNTAAGLAGFLLAGLIVGQDILKQMGQIGQTLLDQADRISTQIINGGRASMGPVLSSYAVAIAPLLALPFIFVLLSLFAQRSIVFAPEKLMPKLSRISPISTAKQKFGRDGLFEFAKSAAKMIAVATILVVHLSASAQEIARSAQLPPGGSIALMLRLMLEFIALTLVLAILFGAVDYFWQQAQHLQRNRMSFQEMKDEAKDSEGDPHAKSVRRQRGQEIALNQMLQDVAKADVIIVNPTHYAVALRWQRSDRHAPVCIAKGVDDIAARIREKAAVAGVPLHSDPPTARAIFAAVEIGAPIRPEHYKAVAAAIRFAEALKARRKGRK